MRRPALVTIVALLLLFAITIAGKNMYVPVSAVADGANGTLFRSDLRIFNPNPAPIAVTIHFLPANQDGSNMPGRVVSVPARGVFVQNNVVEFMQFPRPSVGALRLDSDDTGTSGPDFFATSRIYTDSPNPAAPGTFGQFVPSREATDARRKVAIIQLSNSLDLSTGFRTNVGAMNPGAVASVVTPYLYRSDGSLIKSGAAITVPPQSVVQQSVVNMFALDASNGSFTDGFVILIATEPILGYGSVVDNRSSDQIFILGSEDTATPSSTPSPSGNTVNIGDHSFSPANLTVRTGEAVTWVFNGLSHSTTSDARTGAETWDSGIRTTGSFVHTFSTPGSYRYHCMVHSGPGGNTMNGVITVSDDDDGDGRGY